MDEARLLQCTTDDADAAVHHVRWRHDVHARLGLYQRLLTQQRQRLVIQNIAAFVDQAVLTMAGVGVQGHVRHHAQLREARLQCPHGTGHQAFRIGGQTAVRGLQIAGNGRKQRHDRNPALHALFGNLQKLLDGVAMNARHRADRHRVARGRPIVLVDKDGVDQIVGTQVMFLHQTPGKVLPSVAAHPDGGEGAQVGTGVGV